MMEQFQSVVSYIVIESVIETAILWVVMLVFFRCFKVSTPQIRGAAFLLLLLIPVALPTAFHVFIPLLLPSATISVKFLETLISDNLALPLPVVMVFLLMGVMGIAVSLALLGRQWLACRSALNAWKRQQGESSSQQHRCSTILRGLASKAEVTTPRLVLVDGGGAGSLALGGLGNYILVPQALSVQLDDDELGALLAHELAHVSRRDGLLGCLARVCRNLMLFNPLAYLSLSSFERERERATDDLAVRIGSNRLALASCLLKGYRVGCHRTRLAVVSGLLSHESELERRVRRMLRASDPPPPRSVWLALGALAAVLTVAMVVAL